MWINRFYTILVLALLVCSWGYSQEERSEIFVDFRVNSTQIERGYKDNASRISEIISFLQEVQADSTKSIVNISFCGAASPEGSYEWNRQLAKERMKALEVLVRSKVEIPDSIITYEDSYIPWDYLAKQIATSDLPRKQLILEILDDKPLLVEYYDDRTIDNRVIRLKRLGRKSWKLLLRRYFSPMRNACAVFITIKHEPVIVEKMESVIDTVKPMLSDIIDNTALEATPIITPEWERKLYIKTNTLGLGLAITNAAIEIDLCKHWSFNLPIYYSAWDYSTSYIKFRTFAIQPEIRYWFSEKNLCNDGLYLGAHFGLAYYNIATNGEYRTQDHNGKSPAFGGGLAVGYRMPISKNKRWKLEFSVGAGAYKLHHDKFHNNPNGLLVYTENKNYIGIDQASVSFSYTFDMKRKGGTR